MLKEAEAAAGKFTSPLVLPFVDCACPACYVCFVARSTCPSAPDSFVPEPDADDGRTPEHPACVAFVGTQFCLKRVIEEENIGVSVLMFETESL